MQEEPAPEAPVEAAAPEPPPPPPAEPEREFDITKCAAARNYFRFFYAGFAFAHRAAKAVLLTLLSSLLACAAARSYSITITLGVVFVLSKLAGSLGLIN